MIWSLEKSFISVRIDITKFQEVLVLLTLSLECLTRFGNTGGMV